MTSFKNGLYKLYTWGHYTIAQMRMMTCENGTNKKFSYDEFYNVVGITVEEYDNNVDIYKDMRYEDVKEYLSNKNTNIETI